MTHSQADDTTADVRAGIDQATKDAIASFIEGRYVALADAQDDNVVLEVEPSSHEQDASRVAAEAEYPAFCPYCGVALSGFGSLCHQCGSWLGEADGADSLSKIGAPEAPQCSNNSSGAPKPPVMAPVSSSLPPMPASKEAPRSPLGSIIDAAGSLFNSPGGSAREKESGSWCSPAEEACVQEAAPQAAGLQEWLDQVDAPFSTTLLRLIDERGYDDVEVYKRAGMSRQLFSRIRSDEAYRPAKKTVLALALALSLDAQETRDLLGRAGFALSRSDKRDVIVEYFVTKGIHDLMTVNQALYEFDQPLL